MDDGRSIATFSAASEVHVHLLVSSGSLGAAADFSVPPNAPRGATSDSLVSVLRPPVDLRAVADLSFGGDCGLAADRVRAGSLSAPAVGASSGRLPRASGLDVDPPGKSDPSSSAGNVTGVTASPADVVCPAIGDDAGLGAEDSTSPPPTGSLRQASRASDLDGASFSDPPVRPAGGAQLLLDAFGDHRDIVPCFKTLRRLLGLDLEDPLPSPPDLEARIAASPQNLLVIIGDMLRVDLPAGTWKVTTRRDIMNPSLVAALAPLFEAYRDDLSTPPSLGGGGAAAPGWRRQAPRVLRKPRAPRHGRGWHDGGVRGSGP